MKITVLGSGAAIPVPERHPSAYIIQSLGNAYLLDAGDGITQQLIRHHFKLNTIHSVFISHTHADHAAGIIMLIQTMQQIKRTAPLEVYVPDSVLPGFKSIFPYFQIYKDKLTFDLIFKGITAQSSFQKNNFQIKAVANDHLKGNQAYASQSGLEVSSFSFLIKEKNRQIIYSSDINDFNHLTKYTDNTKILISECTHVSVAYIKKFARSHTIENVILSHIPPGIDNQQVINENALSNKIYISLAKDGQVIEV
ncbi:MAG: MBL fold metallo-hydrolase [bacterium]